MVVFQNAKDQGSENPAIVTYLTRAGVQVGIDINSGYFHVECQDMEKAIPVWDDLFIVRGLSETDLKNYVITAQYIELTQQRE